MTTLPYEVTEPFRMDSLTEELLRSGAALEQGMVVLIEDTILRQNEKFREWAFVSGVLLLSRSQGEMVSFIATYADGHQRVIETSVGNAWYVKKNSKPA